MENNFQRLPLILLLKSGRLWQGPLPWILFALLGCNAGILWYRSSLEAERRANLLESPAGLRVGGGGRALTTEVRLDLSKGNDTDRYWSAIPDARRRPLVILCGMSQMYAINDFKPGDQTISEWMDDATAPRGARVFGLAAPNLCNEEAVLLFLSTLSRPETTPRLFIYGVCFDKFRNLDLRPTYQSFLVAHPEIRADWEEAAKEYAGAYPLACAKMAESLRQAVAEEDKRDDRGFESKLRDVLSRWIPVVGERKALNASIQLHLYLFRNWVFHIKPTTKRPIIEGRNLLNRQFLEMMIDIARKRDVKLALYIIPLNPLRDNPYVPSQYGEFKSWLATLSRERDVPFANLENVVPNADWGTFLDGPDFKHFRGEGHRLTAEAILRQFSPLIFSKPDSSVRSP